VAGRENQLLLVPREKHVGPLQLQQLSFSGSCSREVILIAGSTGRLCFFSPFQILVAVRPQAVKWFTTNDWTVLKLL
jgi:hypothetical protein